MSWGTCYGAPNNIHFDFPGVMNDGRAFTYWNSSYAYNENLKKAENIKDNRAYKQYLINNAESIMKYNQSHAFNYNCEVPIQPSNTNGPPYIFKKQLDKSRPFGYSDSTLKQMYLSRQELQSKQISPLLN